MLAGRIRGNGAVDPSVAQRIKTQPEYLDLVRRRSRFAWMLAGGPAFLLVSFLACIGWFPGVLAYKLTDGGLFTVGMLYGLVIMGTSLCATGWYLRRSAREFEPIQKKLLEQFKDAL